MSQCEKNINENGVLEIFCSKTADKITGWLLILLNTAILLTIASIPFSEGVREFLSTLHYNLIISDYWYMKGIVVSVFLVILANVIMVLRTGSSDIPLELLAMTIMWPILIFIFFTLYILFFPIVYLKGVELITGKGPLF